MEWPLFGNKSPTVLGLDISSAAVKLLELSRHGDSYRVESYAMEPLPSDAMQEKEIKNMEAVGMAIERAVKRSQTKIKYGAIALTGSSVITKVIQMNAELSENEVLSQIPYEAERYIPHPLAEVHLDFQLLGPSSKNTSTQDVFLAASRTEIIDTLVEVLAIGGLTAKIIDIEAYALERAYRVVADQIPNAHEQTIAIADIGSAMTNFSVLNNLKTVYTREQIFGAKQLIEEIQRRYGLSWEESLLATKQGGLPEDYTTEVLNPFKEAVVQQISRALQLCFSAGTYTEVQHIVLAGGGAMLEGLAECVQTKLGVSASVANPFARMSVAPNISVPALHANASSLMVCCGLALRSFT